MLETASPRNFLLRRLPDEQRKQILTRAEFVHLDVRDSVIESNKPITCVDFPESGVISIVADMGNGKLVEVANVGREGFIGIPVIMGVATTAEKAFCQVEASAWRIPTAEFNQLLAEHSELKILCHKYLATFLNQSARNSACNWIHTIEERCARWLLLTHDRVDGDEFFLTQEFLAMMLGVTRGGVNLTAGILAKAGLITYVRGKIIILDRKGLERSTCECYGAIRDYYNETFGLALLENPLPGH